MADLFFKKKGTGTCHNPQIIKRISFYSIEEG